MTTHVQKKILPSDGDQFLVIEYEDYFFTPKNNRIRVKEFGEKVASINSFFFDYLKGFNIPCAYTRKSGKKSLQFLKITDLQFKVKILNAVDKRTAKIFSLKQGKQLELPLFELHYGNSTD